MELVLTPDPPSLLPRAFGARQLKKLHQHICSHWHQQLTLTIFATLVHTISTCALPLGL